MEWVFALLVVFWWLGVWGLSDLMLEGLTKRQKVFVYIVLLLFVSFALHQHPRLVGAL